MKAAGLERAAHGIYFSPDCLTDELYLLQAQFPKAVYSHEAALYLHDLAEKEPTSFSVTFPSSYNSGGLVKKGIKAYYVKLEWYAMGLYEIQTPGDTRGISVTTITTIRIVPGIGIHISSG